MRPTTLFTDHPPTSSTSSTSISSSSSSSSSPQLQQQRTTNIQSSSSAKKQDQERQDQDQDQEETTIKSQLIKADQSSNSNERIKIHYLPDGMGVYSCLKCLIPLALQDELISKAFSGRNGRAYLMHSTINTKIGKKEERRLLTGMHTVADLSCINCSSSLGWVYLKATDREQEYKEGKYILEAGKVIKENNWELEEEGF